MPQDEKQKNNYLFVYYHFFDSVQLKQPKSFKLINIRVKQLVIGLFYNAAWKVQLSYFAWPKMLYSVGII